MVKEMRKIILTADELIAALESYKRTDLEFLPGGKVVKCDLKTGAPATVRIESTYADATKLVEVSLDAPSLLEPMIRFCIENNIVLPRNSRKSALIGDDQAALFIQMGCGENA